MSPEELWAHEQALQADLVEAGQKLQAYWSARMPQPQGGLLNVKPPTVWQRAIFSPVPWLTWGTAAASAVGVALYKLWRSS